MLVVSVPGPCIVGGSEAMVPLAAREQCTVTKVLGLLCTGLTLFLVYQELVTFTVTRPTSVSSERARLDSSTFPEVLEP
jgi:hypothetical protein